MDNADVGTIDNAGSPVQSVSSSPLPTKKFATEETIQRGIKVLLETSKKYSVFLHNKLTDCKQNNSTVIAKVEEVRKCLKYFTGELRPYQLEGITWMMLLFENGINGILADEMGLGKTVQIIALLCHLIQRGLQGPFLILAPLSTLSNWKNECSKFAPSVPVVLIQGDPSERYVQCQEIFKSHKLSGLSKKIFPVVLCSYETLMREQALLRGVDWAYIIVDEGQRIKNSNSKLSLELNKFKSGNRLILTGTPLQNNIRELWSLFYFLMPHLFTDIENISSLIQPEELQDENHILRRETDTHVISSIRTVLAPFILRRMKTDVLPDVVPKRCSNIICQMSDLQKQLYKHILENGAENGQIQQVDLDTSMQPRQRRSCTSRKSVSELIEEAIRNGRSIATWTSNDESAIPNPGLTTFDKLTEKLNMNNIPMQLKKVADHPYLLKGMEYCMFDEECIETSGKMNVLDKLLPKLKQGGHKVLIFSTFSILLDILENYMLYRKYNYRRLDGSMRSERRTQEINDFNTKPDVFVFLLSTRAGGTGINLIAADTVIFFDRDWNPQADLQAQDRCHRIGQTKPVLVLTLVARNSIDETIMSRGEAKRRLEKILIQSDQFNNLSASDRANSILGIRELKKLFEKEHGSSQIEYSEQQLDAILDRTQLYLEMAERRAAKELEVGDQVLRSDHQSLTNEEGSKKTVSPTTRNSKRKRSFENGDCDVEGFKGFAAETFEANVKETRNAKKPRNDSFEYQSNKENWRKTGKTVAMLEASKAKAIISRYARNTPKRMRITPKKYADYTE